MIVQFSLPHLHSLKKENMNIEHSSLQEDYTKEILYAVLTNAVPYQLEFLPIVEIPLFFLQVTHLYKDARRHSCTCVYSQRQ